MSGVVDDEPHGDGTRRPRAFISYAHESLEHQEAVREFWVLLRALGIDARLDLPDAERRRDWPLWMVEELRAADFVLVIASPAYRRRAEGDAQPVEGRGVQFEAALIREEVYRDREAAVARFLPVLLPGGSKDDIPVFLGPTTATNYAVSEFTLAGVEPLVRVLTGQPWEVAPPLRDVVRLPVRSVGLPADALALPGLAHEVVLEVASESGQLRCRALLAGTPLGQREAPLPPGLNRVWDALQSATHDAEHRLADVGRRLGSALLDESTARRLGELVGRSPLGTAIDVVVDADGAALELPYELLRLPDGRLLATLPGVRLRRRKGSVQRAACAPSAGPLKVLVAVGAPDETRTDSAPLDIEAEMQAILDAVAKVEGAGRAQVTFLEVASPQQIAETLGGADRYHVLHLSAHGGAAAVELEDEDGNPVRVDADDLVHRLRAGGRPVPLIVLSSCAGAAGGSDALAATLVDRGADRVLAMQASVTDRYATNLAREFYERLADRETAPPVAAALAHARRVLDDERRSAQRAGRPSEPPEYGIPTLLCADGDPPLLDGAAATRELLHPTVVPAGTAVRELRIGDLIGRRPQLRTALKALRGGPDARAEWGALSGVVMLGVGGIGKTALAGRAITRLRGEGWLAVVHDGVWNPEAFITGVDHALSQAAGADLEEIRAQLASEALEDTSKLDLIFQLIQRRRVLVVFDDFEQNLQPDGGFRDPGFGELFDALCQSAGQGVGRLLVTSRYPPPQTEVFLLPIRIPPLSPAELRRLLLRLPALRRLEPDDRRLLASTIGGHPRLIEFVDALLRGGRGNLTEVTTKLRNLATEHGVAVGRDRELREVIPDAVLLGSRDILLNELVAVLSEEDRELLLQAAVSTLPFSLEDLAIARWGEEATVEQRRAVRAGAERLADLTLLSVATHEPELVVHLWIAEALADHQGENVDVRNRRAIVMRHARLDAGRADFGDLLEICRHYAATDQYEELVGFAWSIANFLGDRNEVTVAAFLGEVVPLAPPHTRGYLAIVDREQQALVLTGRPSAALHRADKLVEVAKDRADRDPSDVLQQLDLSAAYCRLGRVLEVLGDSEQAEDVYRQALALAERAALADPDDPVFQRQLSICYTDLGDALQDQGDGAQAEAFYRKALAIDERGALADPDNAEAQLDLSISYRGLGRLAELRGDSEQAEGLFRQALAIVERLVQADPGNGPAQRGLSLSYSSLGSLAEGRGDNEQAERFYRQALPIDERFAQADRENSQAQRDLSITYSDLGRLREERGDSEEAEVLYRETLAIQSRLAEADPGNIPAQQDLSTSCLRLARLFERRGDSEQAEGFYQQARAIDERVAQPGNGGT